MRVQSLRSTNCRVSPWRRVGGSWVQLVLYEASKKCCTDKHVGCPIPPRWLARYEHRRASVRLTRLLPSDWIGIHPYSLRLGCLYFAEGLLRTGSPVRG